ncbi:MAG: bifunctional hydroxymethylpyrimidine kinase/phosphomethylpyrimidine kinase [Proteobacteria bacterium]|nr:bifunctional hydroxymethylpyrimidine kinase/phosphomethylpyrimidine kinase [Pseudomonadota bacterium]
MTTPTPPRCALTIAGSDSGGGAGIQADLKTFAAHGVHGLSAIAALTAQHTRGVLGVHLPPVDFLRCQIDACFDDFAIGAVKLGMLGSAAVIVAVVDVLATHGGDDVSAPPLVLDPVMIATSGGKLMENDAALDALKHGLLPRATIVTPNLPEAERLCARTVRTRADMRVAAQILLDLGAAAVLLKGGHLDDGCEVVDLYVDAAQSFDIVHPRLAVNAHGTGCTLASAIAANLCRGLALADACRAASDYVHRALGRAYHPGRSDIVVLDHFGAAYRHDGAT